MKYVGFAAVLVLLSEEVCSQVGPTQSILPTVPQWYSPCSDREDLLPNQSLRSASNENMWRRKLLRSLTAIRKQLNVTMEHFKEQLLNDSYDEIQRSVDKLQYVPKWVPGMGNVLMLFGELTTSLKLYRYLPNLHKELQKFSVALEAVSQMETQRALVADTNTRLIQLLCEVERMMVVQQIGVPAPREQRSLVTDEERNPLEVTRRLIRDWGILIKYRDYIHYWRKLLYKIEKQRNSRKLANSQILHIPKV